MNRVYKLVWNRARNMYIAVSEIAKSHRKETLRGGKKSAVIFLVALYLFGTGFVANTVQAESNSPVLTDEQKNEIADKVLEKLNSNENLSKKIKEELFKYTDKLVFAGGVVGKKNSPSDTAMAFGNGAFANGYDAISFGYQADAFSEKAVSIGARASTLYNGDVAIGNQTHVAGLSAAVGSGTQLYANQSVALGTQITIVDPEVLELYKKYNYTNPNKKGAADVPSWYWREQIIKNTPEIQDFEKRYAGFLKTLDEDGLQPTYRDELYKQKLIETILWEKTTKKIQKATAVGFQSGVKVTGGVALGAFSNATRKSEVIGYNPNGEQYQNVADVLVKNNKKEAYVKALQEQETLEEELSDLEKQRKSLSGEKYREISEKAYEKNKESKKASKKVNDLYNAWVSVQGAASVGNEETGMTRQITGVAAGSEDTDAVNVAQLKALNNKIEQNKTNPVKYISINSGNKEKKPADDSDNSKNDGAYGANSVAIGRSAKAAGQFSIALGFQSKAWNEASLSIGRGATTFNQSALAIGHEATALHIRGTAVGYYAVAGRSSIAVGPNGQALGMASVALGEGSYVGDISFREAYKKRNNAPYYYINEVIAKDTEKWENYKNKFKEELKDLSEADAKAKLIALIMSDLNKEVKFSTAIGNQSIVGVSFGTALGYGSRVNSEKAVALGADSLAERSGNPVGYVLGEANSTLDEAITSVGLKDKYDDLKGKTDPDLPTYNELKKRYKEAVKPDDEKQALKDLKNWEKTHEEFLKNLNERKNFEGTWKGSSGVVSVGNKKTGMTRQITGVAAGSEDTDAVNVAQMKVLNTKVDNNRKEMEKSLQNSTVKYFSINPEIDKRPAPADHSDNSKNDGAYGGHSIAIGGFAKASEENAIALGWSAKALDINSLAIGNMIYSYGSGSHVVGNQAAALADDASAFGYQAKAMDMGATALGNNSMAIQNGSTAVGYQSLAAVISTAVGANSFALGQASLALGPHSYTGDTTFRDTYTKYNEEKGNDNNVPGYYIGDLIKNNDDPQIAKYKEQFKDQLNGLDAHNQEALLKHLIIADLNKQVQFATAVGNHSTVGASGGTALGSYSAVTGEYGTALGYNSRVTKKNGTALGYNSTVSADYGVALGNDSIADRGMRELGYNLTSTPWTSLSDLSKHGGFQDSEGLLQKDYKAWVEAYAEQEKKYREWKECSDLLEKDRLKDEYEDLKKKTEKAQLAYGKRQAVWRATEGAVSVGNREKAITRQIIGVAAGTEDTDAVNVAQLKAANSKIEANTKNITNLTTKVDNDKVKYFSVNPEYKIRDHADVNTTNEKNDGAIGKHSMAIGIKTVATGIQALAIGYGAVSEQQHGLAIGLGAEVLDKDKYQSLAIGNDAVVTANFGTAIGQGARVETDDGVAIGVSSWSYRRGTTPGYNPNMTTYTKDVTAYISNDIKQLIEKVKPLEQKERELRRAYQNETDPARKELADKAYKDWTAQHPELEEMKGKIEAAKAVWENDCGTVSFGNDKLHTTSRLVNITAGLEDSDAVNVAQLKALNKKVEDIRDKSSVHYVSVNKEDDIFYDKEYKTNYDNTGASAKHSVAVGYKAAATVEDGVALGSKATAAVTAGKIGYLPGSTDSTIDGVLEKLQLKEKYAALKAKIEPLQAEYKKKLDAFDEARKDPDGMDGEEEDYQKWVTDHPDFMSALKEFNAIESTWKSGAGAISVGDKENGVTRQITNLAAGTEDTDAVNVAQLKAVNYKIDKNTEHITNLTTKVEKGGVKYFSVNPKTENLPTANISSDNSANDGATGLESMAIGKGARAAGQQSIVIGQNAVSEHHGGSIVIGQDAKASGDSEWHGVVVGSRAEVTGGSGVALGNDSKVTAGDGVALGFGSLADREWNVLGYTPNQKAHSLQDRLAGTEYDKLVKKLAPLITEHNQLVDDLNHENDSIKKKEKREKYEAWQAAHPDYNADVKKRDMLKSAWKSGGGAVSVGNSELNATRQIIGVAAGSEDTDAVNVAQLKALNKKVDTNTETINNLNLKVGKGGVHYFSVKADDSGRPAGTNYDNDGATGDFAIAVGYSSVAAGANSIAVGFQAKSPGSSGVAVGNKASANNTSDIAMGINAESSGSWGVAIGGYSQAKGVSGIALGQQAKAESQSGIAIGVQSEATGIWGVAIGQNAKAQASTSVAIACRAEAQNENSVAIGNLAKAIGATSTVIGAQATASGTWGTSVGFFAEASSENGTAVGVNSKVRAKKGIALGAYSVADREGRRIGYSLGGDNSTIDNVLESVGLTEKYNQLESVVNPLIDEYKSLVGVFTKAVDGSAEKAAAKENLKKWEMEHPDFMSATTEMKKILTAWRSGSGALSIGNEEYGITRQIIGVAAGSEDTDAVNVAQLKALATAPMGFDVGGKVENNVYTPGTKNWTMPLNGLRMSFGDGLLAEEVTDKDGKKYTLVKMNDEITIGKAGENGKDGKIGLNGKDGHSAEITVGKGKDGIDGTNGENGITRIIYKDQGNQTHEVATLDDGLKFKGDNNDVVIRKLNTQLNITGGAAAADLSDGNIGVVGTTGDNGGLAVKLSKNLKGLTSAQFVEGDNTTTITGGNISLTKKVNNQNETKNIDLWDLSTTVNNFKGGFTLNGDAGSTVDVTLGETKPAITFKAETKNDDGATSALTAKVDGDKNVTYTLNTKKLKEEMGLTKGVGSMSSWKLKAGTTDAQAIADGDEVEFAVETADKGLTVKREGKKIQYGINADKLVENINSATTKITNVDGDNIDLSNNTSITTINENITKMAGKATKVTVDNKDDNSDDADASLKITKKTVDGQTTYNLSLNDKITIGKDGKDGKIGLNGQDGKSAEITVGKGKDGVDGKNGENGITRIIYKDQGNQTRQVATLDDGLKFKGDNDTVVTRKLNEKLDIKGGITDENLVTTGNIGVFGTQDGGMAVKLSKKLTDLTSAEFKAGDNVTNITAGDVSVTRKEGNENKTVNLWDLSKKVETNAKATIVKVDGEENKTDGNLKIKKTDTNGQLTYDLSLNDEITIGKAGEDGKDGKIGLNGKDGHSAEITVGKGEDGVDGTNGENGITRIIYKDQGNKTHEVATLDDGLKFKGDNDSVVIRKLNTQLNITGGATATDLSDGNIGVVGMTGDDGGLAVKLSKKLKGLTSAEFKDGDNITNITAGNVSITKKVNNENKTVNLWDLSTTVNNFKGGFTIKDATSGTVDVALGETTKSAITFKAEIKDTDGATSALTATVDTNKNVTYTLNTKKLKEEMGLTKGVGSMSSWKLKAGTTDAQAIADGDEVEFAVETADKGLTVKREGKKIQYGINADKLVENINSATTKITNVDWSKFPGMNFYTQGSVNSGIYTPDVNADNKWSSSHIVFGDGIKVEKFKDKDNNQVTRISLDGTGGTGTNGKDGKSAYEIWRDHEENGTQPNKGKGEQDFLDSLKGKDGEKGKDGANGTKGTDGKDGTNGKSAYEIWEAHKDKDGTQPNKGKTEKQFLESLKGKDGTGADIDIKGDTDSGVSVKPNTDTAGKKTYTIGLGTKIKAGEVTIDGTKDKENAVVGDVKINGEKGNGTITGLSNKTWDVNKIVSGRAATEDQLQQATQNMQNHIYEIGKHMNGIAASNAALAGLHPLEYDEDDKWNLSAAIGNYKGANAFALGAFYRPNERTLLSVGGTLAGEEHLLNVGLSLKTGPGTNGKVYASRTAMAREIQKLKEKEAVKDQIMQNLIKAQKEKEAEIKALQEKDAQREKQIRQLMEMVMELKK